MKAPVSHIFSTTNHFLASRIRGFLCLRTDCQWVDSLLTGSFMVLWGPVETDGSFCSACAVVPARRQIFSGTCYLPITRSGEGSLESSRIVEAGLRCYRACRYHSWWRWSPLQYKTLSEEQPFAFCWHLYWEMPFLQRLSYITQLQFASPKRRASVYYPRAHASLIQGIVYISKEAREPGLSRHLRNAAAG